MMWERRRNGAELTWGGGGGAAGSKALLTVKIGHCLHTSKKCSNRIKKIIIVVTTGRRRQFVQSWYLAVVNATVNTAQSRERVSVSLYSPTSQNNMWFGSYPQNFGWNAVEERRKRLWKPVVC